MFLETLLQILKVHARGQRDLGLPLLIHGLSKHRYLRGVRQVEHHEDRALSVLSEGIEGLRLEAVRDPTVYFCSFAAGDDLASGVSVA